MEMTSQHIEEAIGPWAARQERAARFAAAVAAALPAGTEVHHRAKTDESILTKRNRFNESLGEMLDLYGVRVIVPTIAELDAAARAIGEAFGAAPTDQQMTIRGGTMLFPAWRDYRKRDWPGASPATDTNYTEGIHLNRCHEGVVAEVQVMTRASYERFFSPEAVAEFKARQAALYAK